MDNETTTTISIPEWIEGTQFTAEALNDPTHPDHEVQAASVKDVFLRGNWGGTYMPALEYYTAMKTMEKHGDAILEYINQSGLELPKPDIKEDSWGMICVQYVNTAFEEWASTVHYTLNPDE